MNPQPLAVIRPGRTRGPWMIVTQDGGTILWQSRSHARAIEVARRLVEVLDWDYRIDAMESPC